jgi:CheY-like chemotaxis protein
MTKRILLVDDDLYIRDIYLEILQAGGYQVDAAINGEEGLVKLQKGGYDLVILDVMMPKLDGIGVLDSLQKNPPVNKNGPIILLTNLGLDPLMKTAKSKGVASYLIKADLTPQDLLSTVQKFIDGAEK